MEGFWIELFLRGLALWLLAAAALALLRRAAAAYRHLICVAALWALPLARRLMPPLRLLPDPRPAAAPTPEPAAVRTGETIRLPVKNPNSAAPAPAGGAPILREREAARVEAAPR
jgi:hypothetical protein